MQDCLYSADSITRMDVKTGAVLWSTCLPLRAVNFVVDARGAVTVAGGVSLGSEVRATAGAYGFIQRPTGIAVTRLRPDGGAPEWTAMLSDGSFPATALATVRTAVARDGSIFGAATVFNGGLPVTDGAVAGGGSSSISGYFFRLSSDGTKLKYGSYVNDGNRCDASALTIDDEGNVFAGGSCDSFWMGSRPSMATPGTLTTLRTTSSTAAWVARFDIADSRFRYIAVFGQISFSGVHLAAAGRGRVAVVGSIAPRLLSYSQGALRTPDPGRQLETYLLVLNAGGTAAEVAASFGIAEIRGLERDTEGNFVVIGDARDGGASAIATTADAWRPLYGAPKDFAFVMKLKGDGTRVIYSTGLGCLSCTLQGVTRAGDVSWVAAQDGRSGAEVRGPQPVTVSRPETSVLRAMPDYFSHSAPPAAPPVLYWDTRDSQVQFPEVRRDTSIGTIVGRGPTGAIFWDGVTESYYFTDGPGQVLATEHFTRYVPVSDVSVAWTAQLQLSPNPVLSCRERPLTGTAIRVTAYGDTNGTDVRVGSPTGPIFTAGESPITDVTGDWVRNGMSFYLNTARWGVVGSARAYVLPNRSCTSNAPPQPMILATRDCVQKDRFTLAWWASTSPVEVREGGATGVKVARAATNTGLFEVTATVPTAYALMAWRGSDWELVATTAVDPKGACGQGVAQ